MKLVEVVARWTGEGWVAHLPEHGPITASTLGEVQGRAGDVVRQGVGERTEVVVRVQPKFPLSVGRAVQDTLAVRTEAAGLAARAEALTASTSAELRGLGLSEVDVRATLGLPVAVGVNAPVSRPVGRPRRAVG